MKKVVFLSIIILKITNPLIGQFQAMDTSFGNNGLVTFDCDPSKNAQEEFRAIELQSDGKILALGYNRLFRYNSNGTLDSTFGRYNVGYDTVRGQDMAVQKDGKMLLVEGFFGIGASRYDTNGIIDSTFNKTGHMGVIYRHMFATILNHRANATAVAIQPDGKSLVGGTYLSGCWSGYGCYDGMALLRININGSVDTSFGDTGRVHDPGNALGANAVNDIAIQSNGRILLTGYTNSIIGLRGFAFIRAVDSSGFVDSAFGSNGEVNLRNLARPIEVNDIAVLPNDDYIVAGSVGGKFALMKFKSDGKSMDTTYGDSGFVYTNFSKAVPNANGLVLKSNGEMMAVGTGYNYLPGGITQVNSGIGKYLSDGTLDSICDFGKLTFGQDSIENIHAYKIKLQKDGKILVAGSTPKRDKLAMMRFHQNWPLHYSAMPADSVCEGYEFNGTEYFNSGVYFDTLSSIQGCDSVVTLNLTINEVETEVIQTGPNLVTTATNATYQWINCHTGNPISGETSQSFTANFNGSYAVIVTQNGCSDTSACFEVTGVGIPELTSADINIYPNPSNGSFTVELPDSPVTQFTVLNMQGSIIYQKQLTNNRKVEINLDAPKRHIYLEN